MPSVPDAAEYTVNNQEWPMGKRKGSGSTPTTFAQQIKVVLDNHPGTILTAIMGLALLLRFVAFLNLKQSVYFDFMLWDERLYHQWAEKIADGTFTSGSVYEFAPLPAYFIALVYKIFSPDIVYIRYANIAFGVATCGLIYLIGKEIGDRVTAAGAGLIAALCQPLIFYSIVPLKTALSLLLFSAMVYSFTALITKKRVLYAFGAAVFLGLVNNVRPNAVILAPVLPVLAVWVLYRGKTPVLKIGLALALYAAGLAAAHAPFAVRNYLVAGEALPTPSQGGILLYMCNNFDYPKGIPFATTSPTERGIQFTIEASRQVGTKLTQGEAADYWKNRVLNSIVKNPGKHVGHLFEKGLIFFNWFEKGDHYNIGFISDFVIFFKFPWLTYWAILPLAMAGMLVGSFRSRKMAALCLVFFAYGSGLVLFFTNIRMRLPLMIILIPFAVLGAQYLFAAIRQSSKREAAVILSIAVAFIVIEFLPVRKTWDMTGFYNTHAIILDSQGDESGAMAWWLASTRLKGRYSAFAHLSLSGKYMKRGKVDKALSFVNEIPDNSFAVALKYEMLGDIFVAQRKIREAVNAYEKALEINSGLRRIRFKLAKIFERIDRRRARLEYAKLAYIDSFYDLYLSKGRPGSTSDARGLSMQ
jgi:4-amino-4-deoxy-L-arabinose transferase-like glycosyltransferase